MKKTAEKMKKLNEITSEIEYLEYKQQLKKILMLCAIGFAIGFILGMFAFSSSTEIDGIVDLFQRMSGGVVLGLLLAGVPYAWHKMPFIALGLVSLFIKIILCIFLGWIMAPIGLLYNFLNMKKVEKQIMNNDNSEQ